jgi:hypothetical protein
MKKLVTQSTLCLGLLTLVAACGPKLQSVSNSSQKDGSIQPDDNRRETVTIGVGVEEGSTAGFALAAATSYSMSLEGCASGLSYPSITQANPNVDVYKFDQGCLVKLNSFSINGISYVPTSGDPFGSWVAGDIATFEESGNPTNTLRVVVSSQLASPISGTESVAYAFSQIAKGADETLAKTVVGGSHSLSVAGQDATPLTIQAVSFVGMTAGGAGQFVFTLECGQNVTGTAPALSCAGTSMDDLKYRLVADTTSSSLDLTQAAALFDGSETSIGNAQRLDVGQGGTTRGGFITVTLDGPAQMHNNPNMILAIQAGGASYRYFNVDVTTLTYP